MESPANLSYPIDCRGAAYRREARCSKLQSSWHLVGRCAPSSRGFLLHTSLTQYQTRVHSTVPPHTSKALNECTRLLARLCWTCRENPRLCQLFAGNSRKHPATPRCDRLLSNESRESEVERLLRRLHSKTLEAGNVESSILQGTPGVFVPPQCRPAAYEQDAPPGNFEDLLRAA
eukprot:5242421-Amphidinium_carterae.1